MEIARPETLSAVRRSRLEPCAGSGLEVAGDLDGAASGLLFVWRRDRFRCRDRSPAEGRWAGKREVAACRGSPWGGRS